LKERIYFNANRDLGQRVLTRSFRFMLIIGLISCTQLPDLAKLFSDAGVTGTMVISNLKGDQTYVHDSIRADLAMLPASTFKIANSLISLDAGAISSVDEVISWDGQKRFLASWDGDQTMRTALPISCVWFYQELARRVGNDRYLIYLDSLSYGNAKTGPDVTTFWLSGDLRISALGQVAFLKRLYSNELPFKREHMDLVKEIMLVEETESYKMRVKTGWAIRVDDQIGWYVGWLETSDDVWFFAMNMDIIEDSDAHWRKDLVESALESLGLMEDD